MEMRRCPGQDQRYWKPEDIFQVRCPQCGDEIEFWKDEPVRTCGTCRAEARNPRMDFGCAAWCRSAAECVGADLAASVQSASLCDRLVAEMKAGFSGDVQLIEHTMNVLGYARKIQQEEGGDSLVVQAAALLHDIGIPEALRKHGSAEARFQEEEGALLAEAILARLAVPPESAEHIRRIVASHHSARDIDTLEFRIVWDADALVNWSVTHNKPMPQLPALIEAAFRTAAGRALAQRLFM